MPRISFQLNLMKSFCCGVLLSALLFAPGCKPSANKAPAGEAIVDYNALRMEVVKAVQSGELKAAANGAIELPDKWAETSQDGEVYATVSPASGQLVAFRTMSGGSFGQGLLYAEKAIGKDTPSVQVGPYSLTIRGKAGEHWYRVGG